MNNVYDIKHKNNLNFILPINKRLGLSLENTYLKKIVIIMHFYYLETVKNYFKYIDSVPHDIDIIFTVSDKKVKEELTDFISGKDGNYKIIEKNNRGRDISALLVACRKEILKYDFFCFLHDKKEKKKEWKEDTEIWIRCLWENMIGSTEYIENIRGLLMEKSEIGLLAPPIPLSDFSTMAYDNVWYDNFDLTKELAKNFKLKCDLVSNRNPITLGTVFWAKTEALKKILLNEWKYDDFPEEPLSDDGTVSHALERFWAYVAQDAGYKTGWVMTDRYAAEQMEYSNSLMPKAFHYLNKSMGISRPNELIHYEEIVNDLKQFRQRYQTLYIFGTGIWGKRCHTMLRNEKIEVEAFLVSPEFNKEEDVLEGKPIYTLDQVELEPTCGIIVAIGMKNRDEIMDYIYKKNEQFTNIYFMG